MCTKLLIYKIYIYMYIVTKKETKGAKCPKRRRDVL